MACRSSAPTVGIDAAPPSSSSPAGARPTTDTRPTIVAFGDSLTAGFGTDPGESYPDYLQKDLDAQGYHYHVINAGISGNTTKDGVERLDSGGALQATAGFVP